MARKPTQSPSEAPEETTKSHETPTTETAERPEPTRTETEDGFVVLDY